MAVTTIYFALGRSCSRSNTPGSIFALWRPYNSISSRCRPIMAATSSIGFKGLPFDLVPTVLVCFCIRFILQPVLWRSVLITFDSVDSVSKEHCAGNGASAAWNGSDCEGTAQALGVVYITRHDTVNHSCAEIQNAGALLEHMTSNYTRLSGCRGHYIRACN